MSQPEATSGVGTASQPVLAIRDLQKVYNAGRPDEREAVARVSFEVGRGDFVCVV